MPNRPDGLLPTARRDRRLTDVMRLHRIANLPPGLWLAQLLCVPVVLFAVADVVGWYTHVGWLTRPVLGSATMKPSTAAALLVLGLAVLVFPLGARARAVAVAALTGVGAFAVASLVEVMAGVSFGIDNRWPGLSFPGSSGRPSPFTSVCLLLLVVEFHGARWWWHRVREATGLAVLAIAYLGFAGFLLGAPHLYRVAGYSSMAFATAVSLCLLALAGLLLDRTRGLMGLLADHGAAGRLIRTLLPFLVAGPVLLGWLRLLGQRAGWYDATFGEAISTMALTATGLGLLLHAGTRIRRSDADRDRADAELRELNLGLEAVVAERTAALTQAQAYFAAAFASSPLGAALTTVDGVVRDVNRVLPELTGRRAEELVGSRVADLFVDDQEVADVDLRAKLLHGEVLSYQLERTLRHDHRNVFVQEVVAQVRDDSGLHGLLFMLQDVTARKQAEAYAEHLALHDSLTDLPNRVLLMDRLAQALRQAQRSGRCVGVLFLDLDRFKPVNDTYGHQAGDEVLRQVGRRLRVAIRATDTAGRFGGDEFVVICPQVRGPDDLTHVIDAITRSIEEPVAIGDVTVQVGVSIGVALGRGDDDPDRLIRQSDHAMYDVKQGARHG